MNEIDKLRILVRALLASEKEIPTQQRIREIIAEVRLACPRVTDEEAENLAIEFETIHGVIMTDGAALEGQEEFEPWLDTSRSGIDFKNYYWGRYRDFMTEKGLSSQVLAGLSNVTDRILGLLENPNKTGKWDRRGMVMGHVQSGKTANYIGLITKAADAGYKVVIIIAGSQNRLRNQTQQRVDEGFIGFSATTKSKRFLVGVGKYDQRYRPNAFTTSYRDFHKGIAESLNIPLKNLREPAVFVIKKNSNTLRNLIDWLKTHNAQHLGTDTIQEPMLLIDDEADNASINIKRNGDEVSRINSQIRQLLNLFDRSNYVGYTATPFANIFIDPDSEHDMVGHDLFPRDFIVSLDPPTNYFGPTRVFGNSQNTMLHDINDYEDLLPMPHPKNHIVTELPESLKESIRVFILARAIRLIRGQTHSHNSMLVNVSRFIAVQQQTRNKIQEFVDRISSSIKINGARPVNEVFGDPELAKLHNAYKKHYVTYKESWSEIQKYMYKSINAITVVEINSRATGLLNYNDCETSGLNVIAVGGFSLSRGLTLEGLTVSYFLRRSMMYDTLFQMGRWFGYRDGYDDLCRIWMPEEAQGWYEHITDSIEELRDELVQMQNANATPRDFGLKIRSHPDTLVVTARNKMGSSNTHTVQIGLEKSFIETAILYRDESTIKANLQAAIRLVNTMRVQGHIPENDRKDGQRLVYDVPVDLVDAFLRDFKNHPGSHLTNIDPVRQHIENRSRDELSRWNILFAGVTGNHTHKCKSLVNYDLGFKLICQYRTCGRRSNRQMIMVTNKQRVSSRGITRVDLTHAQRKAAEEEYNKKRSSLRNPQNYPDKIYQNVRTKPLLVIHLLAIAEKDNLIYNMPVTAWSIGFPKTKYQEKKVEYVVNTTWYQEHYGEDDSDEEDDYDVN